VEAGIVEAIESPDCSAPSLRCLRNVLNKIIRFEYIQPEIERLCSSNNILVVFALFSILPFWVFPRLETISQRRLRVFVPLDETSIHTDAT
jgi:hypothetical protein